MKRNWIAALVMGITILTSGAAQANDNPTHQCVADARATQKTCSQVCRDDFLSAVDTCRGQNHDCAQAARDAREACVSDVLHTLGQCVDDTCGVFKTLIDQCRTDFAAGSPERDACVDGAQVQNFQCRDQCRETVKLFQSLKTCRDEFKTDIHACTPPVVMAP
jgi:hypothetical protein